MSTIPPSDAPADLQLLVGILEVLHIDPPAADLAAVAAGMARSREQADRLFDLKIDEPR